MKTNSWSRVGPIIAVLSLVASVIQAQGDELLVTNVQAEQRPFNALVDVTYDLESVGDIPVSIILVLSTDAGASYSHRCQCVSGDVGSGVLPGTSRQITWDVGEEFPGFSNDTCRLKVIADDADNLSDFAYVAPGTFIMGSPTDEPGRWEDEGQHQVTLTHGTYVQSTEVTNQQYMELAQWAYDQGYATVTGNELHDNLDGSTTYLMLLGNEISFNAGVFSCINPDYPVKYVTWFGSVAYCDWLSLQQNLVRAYQHYDTYWFCNGGNSYTAVGYRLPTEAEWEYACRAGSTTAFANGPITYLHCSPLDPNLDLMGWYCGNASSSQPVAQKLPNAWGLYDMHGNVFEWCNDWGFGVFEATSTDPIGPDPWSPNGYRAVRGGNWHPAHGSEYCRSAFRNWWTVGEPNTLGPGTGFRVVRSVF